MKTYLQICPAAFVLACLAPSAPSQTPAGVDFFEKKIRPVLVEHCYRCHSATAKKVKGGLQLDTRQGLLKGGDSGPSLIMGQPDKSRLIAALRHESPELTMPPGKKLPDAVIADFVAWIKMGAPDLRTGSTAIADSGLFSEDKRKHWAWKVPVRPRVPSMTVGGWAAQPIDAFILAKLAAAGLKPAAPASREQLLRRATFDLIGLPPTPDEIDAFVNDRSSEAWAKAIDRLLASPHYGERWGRHWLDLARFAESNGYEFDEPRPNAWRYRDYVIASFNADKPYDRFIKEQLAGDEIAPDDPQALIATGFNLLGPDMTDASSQAQRRQNTLDDMTDTASLAFLGLTVGCARCHDHKFEPIAQTDYYRMQAFFAPAEFRRDLPVADAGQKAAFDKQMQAYQSLTGKTKASLDALEAPYRQKLIEARLAKLSEAVRRAYQTPEAQRTPAQKEDAVTANRLLTIQPKDVAAAMTKEDRARQDVLLQELKKFDERKPIVADIAGPAGNGQDHKDVSAAPRRAAQPRRRGAAGLADHSLARPA